MGSKTAKLAKLGQLTRDIFRNINLQETIKSVLEID